MTFGLVIAALAVLGAATTTTVQGVPEATPSPDEAAVVAPEAAATSGWSFELCKAAGSTVIDLSAAYSTFVDAVSSGSVTTMVGAARRLDTYASWALGDLDEVPAEVPAEASRFVAAGTAVAASAKQVAEAATMAANTPRHRRANARRLTEAVERLSEDLTSTDAAQAELFAAYPGVCEKPAGTVTTFTVFNDHVHDALSDIGGVIDDLSWNIERSRWKDVRHDLVRLEARVDEEYRSIDTLAPTECWADSVEPWRSAIRTLEIAEREGTRWVQKRTDDRWDSWITALQRFDRANGAATDALNEVRIQNTFGRCD